MRQKVKTLFANPVISGSLVMIIGSNLGSAINYVYHLLMGRLLNLVSYGELSSLISVMGLVGTLPSILGPVIIKYVSASSDKEEIDNLLSWLGRRVFLASVLIMIGLVIFSVPLAGFLKIERVSLFWIVGATFVPSLSSFLYKSVLQGMLRFNKLVISQIVENGVKLIAGISLVYLGFSTSGAMVGILISLTFGWWFSRYFISDVFVNKNSKKPNLLFLGKYSLFVAFQAIALTSFYTTDVLLVKHFFTPSEAGLYAAVSRLGQIIFFVAGPIGSVMFANASRRHAQGGDYHKIFFYSFALTTLAALSITLAYTLFPTMVVTMLYGHKYLAAGSLLGPFAIFMSLFTLATLSVNFFLSVNQTKVVWLAVIAALVQALGIWFYHRDINQVIFVSIITSALLLSSLSVYFVYESQARLRHRTGL